MKKYTSIFLCFVLLVTLSGNVVYANDNALTLPPASSSKNTNLGTITFDKNPLTRSTPQSITFYAGNFTTSEEQTLEEIVENESNENGNNYSITIAVEQPNPGTYDCVSAEGSGKKPTAYNFYIGHTFILLGNHVPESTVFYARGFYPNESLSEAVILDEESIKGIIRDDAGHSFTVRKTYWVDLDTFNDAIFYLQDMREKVDNGTQKYNLVNFNCTTFGKQFMEAAGIYDTGIADHNWVIPNDIKDTFRYMTAKIEKAEKKVGCYPGAAGEQLRTTIKDN